MDHATIEDLDINPALKITPMVKQNLVNIINDEFCRQKTIYDSESSEKKEKILEDYKRSVGFDKMSLDLQKANDVVTAANKKVEEFRKKLHLKGLDSEGQRHHVSAYGVKTKDQLEMQKAEKKIDNLLRAVEDAGPNNVRNKIISRLWLADTAGEVTVILRQVLGNGLIPAISVKDIKQLSGPSA